MMVRLLAVFTIQKPSRWLFFFASLIFGFPTFAQMAGTIKGVVSDSSGKPLEGVAVGIEGSPTGTLTEKNGNYQLTIPAGEPMTIVFSSLGFHMVKKRIQVSDEEIRVIHTSLQSKLLNLPEAQVESQRERTENMIRLDPKSFEAMPNPSGNIEAILKTLPGVGSSNELSAQYNVRGGNYDENLVYVNDVEVYRPFLVRSGQQEGLSFVNSDLVHALVFSAGGFESRFGDKMSSVLDIQYIRPQKTGGAVTLSLLGSNVSVFGANKAKNFFVLAGARYKTNQYLLKTFDTKGEYRPRFYDFQTMLTREFGKKWELTFLGNYSNNTYQLVPSDRQTEFGTVNEALRLTMYFDGKEDDRFETGFGALKLTHRPSKRVTLKYIASAFNSYETETFDILAQYYLDELEKDIGKNEFGDAAFNRGVGSYLIHARNYLDATVGNVEHKGNALLKNHQLDWGIQYRYEFIRDEMTEWSMVDSAGFSVPRPIDSAGYINPAVQPYQYLYLNRSVNSAIDLQNNRFTGYFQNTFVFRKNSPFHFIAGIRAHYLTSNQQTVWGPRGSIIYKPAWMRKTTFRLSSGMYFQPPFYREMRDADGLVNPGIRAQKSSHFLAGTDYYFNAWNRPFKLVFETYFKLLENLVPYKIDNVRIQYLGKNNANGYAYGADMRINGEFVKGTESWLSISYLKTEEDLDGDFFVRNYNSDGVEIVPGFTYNDSVALSDTTFVGRIPRPADQRFSFGIFFQDYLPKFPTFKMHVTVLFSTGLPFGPPGKDRWKDQLRMPPYRRADIGFSKQFIGGASKWIPKGKVAGNIQSFWISLEVFNLLQVSNTISYLWVKDVTGRSYAVPNYLTARQLNLAIHLKF